jgi:hypothetical protein
MLPSLCEKFVIFLVTAEEMERTLGDLGPNNWENGIQVGLYINKLHILFLCEGKSSNTLDADHLCCYFSLIFRLRRNEPTVKGTILFDANSTITVSPVNFK